MVQFMTFIRTWLESRARGDRGATMVEYGLMVALIAVVALGAVQALGIDVLNTFQAIANAI